MAHHDTPSMALSFRLENLSLNRTKTARKHDLRIGPQPRYIDQGRMHLNSVLIEPAQPSDLRRMCIERRALRQMHRAMKSDAAISTAFIITFGKGIQPYVEALPPERQDQMIRAISDAVMARLGTDATGLVVHRDETAFHAHGQMPSLHPVMGLPLSKVVTRRIASELQDIAMEAARPFLPMIERGVHKVQRIVQGDDPSRIYNRSVRELHEDLPREIEARREQIDLLARAEASAADRVEEMRRRVAKLDAQAELSQKEIQRREVYAKRLDDRLAELKAAEAALAAARADEERRAALALQKILAEARQVQSDKNDLAKERAELEAGFLELGRREAHMLQEEIALNNERRQLRLMLDQVRQLLPRMVRWLRRSDLPRDAVQEGSSLAIPARDLLRRASPAAEQPSEDPDGPSL